MRLFSQDDEVSANGNFSALSFLLVAAANCTFNYLGLIFLSGTKGPQCRETCLYMSGKIVSFLCIIVAGKTKTDSTIKLFEFSEGPTYSVHLIPLWLY